MKYKIYEYHGYFLAYYLENKSNINSNTVYVLLGKKNFFNRYLHNNPGQYVIPGGRCNFNKKNEILREFQEETGHTPKNRIFENIEIKSINYKEKVYANFYNVTDNEFIKFNKLDFNNRDWRERELCKLKWFKLQDALELMESGQICKENEIYNISKKFLTKKRLLNWYKYNKKQFITDEEVDKLLLYRENDKELYSKYFKEFKKDIFKKGCVDWYIHILNYLKEYILLL